MLTTSEIKSVIIPGIHGATCGGNSFSYAVATIDIINTKNILSVVKKY